MLILHCSDLHLGKTLHERDLHEDQAFMLDRIAAEVSSRRPAAVLIAGDIYDRSIPQPEAIGLFDSFLMSLMRSKPEPVVLAVTGNHDSPARLSFASKLLAGTGLHIRTRPEECANPVFVESGAERVALWALPFLGAGVFAQSDSSDENNVRLRGQAELFAEAMSRIGPRLDPTCPNILVAHCFARGGQKSDSERDFLGGAEEVDVASFESFDYVALGHLHRNQAVGSRGRYPGSPLAYSFGEAGQEKGILLLEVGKGYFEEEFVPILPLRRVVRLEGCFSELAAAGSHPEHRDDYVEARLLDRRAVLNPADPLRLNFPHLLSVRQAAFELAAASDPPAAISGIGAGIEEDFARFHVEMLGEAPRDGVKELFSALAAEASIEAT